MARRIGGESCLASPSLKGCPPNLLCHPDGHRVIIHEHRPGQTLNIGTLKETIENEVSWDEDDLKRLKLLKSLKLAASSIILKDQDC